MRETKTRPPTVPPTIAATFELLFLGQSFAEEQLGQSEGQAMKFRVYKKLQFTFTSIFFS